MAAGGSSTSRGSRKGKERARANGRMKNDAVLAEAIQLRVEEEKAALVVEKQALLAKVFERHDTLVFLAFKCSLKLSVFLCEFCRLGKNSTWITSL